MSHHNTLFCAASVSEELDYHEDCLETFTQYLNAPRVTKALKHGYTAPRLTFATEHGTVISMIIDSQQTLSVSIGFETPDQPNQRFEFSQQHIGIEVVSGLLQNDWSNIEYLEKWCQQIKADGIKKPE